MSGPQAYTKPRGRLSKLDARLRRTIEPSLSYTIGKIGYGTKIVSATIPVHLETGNIKGARKTAQAGFLFTRVAPMSLEVGAGDTAWAPRCSVGRTAGFRDFDGETPSCAGLCGGRTRKPAATGPATP